MIIKLNMDSTITIEPQNVPEHMNSIYLTYIFPKGLEYLRPVLNWGGEVFEGKNKYINKQNTLFDMEVLLYNGSELYKTYKSKVKPDLFIGYHTTQMYPDMLKHIRRLEQENKRLKERGDII